MKNIMGGGVIGKMDKNKLCCDMVTMFREQRHDLLNHFQVILGYLQLNKIDRAVTYIKQANLEMQELSGVTKLENPYLVLALLLALQKSKNIGVRLFFHIESGCLDYREFITNQLVGIIDQCLQCLSASGKEEPWMEISLEETDHTIIWVITGAPFFQYEELGHQLHNQLDQGFMTKRSLQVDKLPEEEIRLIFHISKNN